jgi:hypothetical protein
MIETNSMYLDWKHAPNKMISPLIKKFDLYNNSIISQIPNKKKEELGYGSGSLVKTQDVNDFSL